MTRKEIRTKLMQILAHREYLDTSCSCSMFSHWVTYRKPFKKKEGRGIINIDGLYIGLDGNLYFTCSSYDSEVIADYPIEKLSKPTIDRYLKMVAKTFPQFFENT